MGLKLALETGIKQPGMDATWEYFKEVGSEGVCVVGDFRKLTIRLSRKGKLSYDYGTLPGEISIEKREDGEFVFTDSAISDDALQTVDRLLSGLRGK